VLKFTPMGVGSLAPVLIAAVGVRFGSQAFLSWMFLCLNVLGS